MVSPAAGAVVLIRFPFSDLSQVKLRPALVLAPAGRGDWILCQITSSPYGEPRAVSVSDSDFSSGGLRTHSYIRPGKLFTANASLIVDDAGMLKARAYNGAVESVILLLRESQEQSNL